MNNDPKTLVVDKDVFQGTSTEDMVEFVKNHLLILSQELLLECLTTDDEWTKECLLYRFRRTILAGGHICPRFVRSMVPYEAERLTPYGPIWDKEYSDSVRHTYERNTDPYNHVWVEESQRLDQEFVNYLARHMGEFTDYLASEKQDALQEVRHENHSNHALPARLAGRAEFVNAQDLHYAANKLFRGMTNCPEKFCLSEQWISWQYVRVFLTWLTESKGKSQAGGYGSREKLEHDLQDIMYVTHISRADGLLTRDEELVIPLARAAFPNKDVFSSLDEVLDTYRCDWT
jgi:hypothetical protein